MPASSLLTPLSRRVEQAPLRERVLGQVRPVEVGLGLLDNGTRDTAEVLGERHVVVQLVGGVEAHRLARLLRQSDALLRRLKANGLGVDDARELERVDARDVVRLLREARAGLAHARLARDLALDRKARLVAHDGPQELSRDVGHCTCAPQRTRHQRRAP